MLQDKGKYLKKTFGIEYEQYWSCQLKATTFKSESYLNFLKDFKQITSLERLSPEQGIHSAKIAATRLKWEKSEAPKHEIFKFFDINNAFGYQVL